MALVAMEYSYSRLRLWAVDWRILCSELDRQTKMVCSLAASFLNKRIYEYSSRFVLSFISGCACEQGLWKNCRTIYQLQPDHRKNSWWWREYLEAIIGSYAQNSFSPRSLTSSTTREAEVWPPSDDSRLDSKPWDFMLVSRRDNVLRSSSTIIL